MRFTNVFTPRHWWLALAPVVALASADVASAQQLRGPPVSLRPSTFAPIATPGVGVFLFGPQVGPQFVPGTLGNQIGPRYTAQLMPGKPLIPLLNNGTLQISQNPALPLTPNVTPYSYIAAVPLGDRLGKNGIFYDQDLITSIGFTPAAPNLPGYPGPIAPYTYQAIGGQAYARQRMAYGMYASSMYAQAAYARSMQMYGAVPQAPAFANAGFGGFVANNNIYGAVMSNPAQPQLQAFGGFGNKPEKKDDKEDAKDDKDDKKDDRKADKKDDGKN